MSPFQIQILLNKVGLFFWNYFYQSLLYLNGDLNYLLYIVCIQSSLAGYSPWGHNRVRHDLVTKQFYIYIGEGNGTPLQYSCLEYPMDGGAWWAAVHGITKSRTRLSDFTFIFHFHPLEKEMATHSSVLAWRIPGMGEPGGLPSMGSHRVGHNWSNLVVYI